MVKVGHMIFRASDLARKRLLLHIFIFWETPDSPRGEPRISACLHLGADIEMCNQESLPSDKTSPDTAPALVKFKLPLSSFSAVARGMARHDTLLVNNRWPPRFSPARSPGDVAEMGWQQSTGSASNQLASRDPHSASPMMAAAHPWGFSITVQEKRLLVLHRPHSLMLLLWAIWTRAEEVVWGGGRHSGKGEASCFGWCYHHRLMLWKLNISLETQ